MEIQGDPRFTEAVELFNAGDFAEAAELFEDLFFESIRDEVSFVRLFLQISTGIHHVERGQLRAAVERLEEGIRVASTIRDDGGYDVEALVCQVTSTVEAIRLRNEGSRERISWPRIAMSDK